MLEKLVVGAPDRMSVGEWLSRWRYWLLAGAAFALAILLFEALRALTQQFHYAQVVLAIQETTGTQLALAVFATAVSFLTLTGYDWCALRYIGAVVPYKFVAQTAFIAYAVSNTVGVGVLTGGAVRMRIYGSAGLEAGAISEAIGFGAIAFGLGISTVGAASLLIGAAVVAPVVHMPALAMQGMAGVVIAVTGALLWHCHRSRELRLFGFKIHLPPVGLAAQQLIISVLDISASAGVLWALLPHDGVTFPAFVGFYAIATMLGVISHVPGGLGVFEAVMLVALGRHLPPEKLAGALVLYRLIYHVLPLALALGLLLVHEARRGVIAPMARVAASLSPFLLSAFMLITGGVLLVFGVTPSSGEALALLAMHVPLPLIESTHFLSSIAGVVMLFVARGLAQRQYAAWWAGIVVTLLGLVLAIPKGLALFEAVILAFLAASLTLARGQFKRPAGHLFYSFGTQWWLGIGALLIALAGLLGFAYRDVTYAHELWWQFEFEGHAPRSLRALVALIIASLFFAFRQLMRPPVQPSPLPSTTILLQVGAIVDAQESADACLALMGDKHIIFSDSGNAFVMFGRRGRSLIALFDPVGPRAEWPNLIWRFIENARESGGRASFYQVRPETLSVYLDAGLRLFKLGENAHVALPDFSLKGKSRANLRQGVSRAERDGLSFEVITTAQVPAILPDLKIISDAWLGAHNTAEKSFSLGSFNEAYIVRQSVAVIRRDQRVVAFATLLSTACGVDASVDLMRYRPDAPKGSMDFLFAKVMLHFQEQGYQRFGLGMAPLSGMATHPLAPNWHRLGRLLFTHGEHFYNFQGLRAFKEKFDPVWEARYLASPGGALPLLVLTDVAVLISGGLKGVISK